MTIRRAEKYGDDWLPIWGNRCHSLDNLEKTKEVMRRFRSHANEARRFTEELPMDYIVTERISLLNDPTRSKVA